MDVDISASGSSKSCNGISSTLRREVAPFPARAFGGRLSASGDNGVRHRRGSRNVSAGSLEGSGGKAGGESGRHDGGDRVKD